MLVITGFVFCVFCGRSYELLVLYICYCVVLLCGWFGWWVLAGCLGSVIGGF